MFQQLLQETLNRVDGALACALMGFDGIVVDSVQLPNFERDPATLGTELSGHVTALLKTYETLQVGPLAEISLRAAHHWAVIRLLNRDYFLVLFLRPGGNIGKGHYLLRQLAPKVRQEF